MNFIRKAQLASEKKSDSGHIYTIDFLTLFNYNQANIHEWRICDDVHFIGANRIAYS